MARGGFGLGLSRRREMPRPGSGGATYPIDSLTLKPILSYSYSRALSRLMIGKPIARLRRSNDNAESDFGTTPAGVLDRAAVLNWLGVPLRPLDALSVQPAAAYGLRLLRTAYAGQAVNLRRSNDNVEKLFGFTPDGDLDTAEILKWLDVPARPLDVLSVQAAAAFGLRRLRTGYLGPAIRVRHGTTNAERDIGFTASGDLDTATLLAFCGAGSGFVVSWYDQSGLGRHASQATAAAQPRIVNAGSLETLNGRPTVRNIAGANAGALGTSLGATFALQTPVTAVGILNPIAFNGADSVWFDGVIPDSMIFRQRSATAGDVYQNGYLTQAYPWAAGTPMQSTVIYNASTSGAWRSGTPVATAGGMASGNIGGISIGARLDGYRASDVQWSELIVFSSALSASDRARLERSQAAYYNIAYATTLPSAFVVSALDQMGSASHLTQTTAVNQPRIVNAGVVETLNNRATMRMLGGTMGLSRGTSENRSAVMAVARHDTVVDFAGVWGASNFDLGLRLDSGAASAARYRSVAADMADAGGFNRLNGTQTGDPNPTANISIGVAHVIGAQNGTSRGPYIWQLGGYFAGRYLNGAVSELIEFNVPPAANDWLLMERSEAAYYSIAYATPLPSAFVVTAYEQTGTTNHLTQATAVSQPRIVNAGVFDAVNGRAVPVFDGSDDFMLSTQNIGLSGDPLFTINMVHTMALPSNQVWLSWGSDAPGAGFHYMGKSSAQNIWFGYASQVQIGEATVPNASAFASMTITRTGTGGAAWTVRRNGTLLSVTPGDARPVALVNGVLQVGRWVGNSLFANMQLGEINVFNAAQPAAEAQMLQQDQGAFYGYEVA